MTEVTKQQYAGTSYVQINTPRGPLLRRLADGKVNASQLLNFADITPDKQEEELKPFLHELDEVSSPEPIVCGSYIPVNAAEAIATRYGLLEQAKPLLKYTETSGPNDGDASMPDAVDASFSVPEHETMDTSSSSNASVLTRNPAHEDGDKTVQKSLNGANPSQNDQFTPSLSHTHTSPESTHSSKSANEVNTANRFNSVETSKHENPEPEAGSNAPKRRSLAPLSQPAGIDLLAPEPHPETVDPSYTEDTTVPPLQIDADFELADLSREVVTELFLATTRGETQTLAAILQQQRIPHIEIDVPIDDAGHTALHWASALAKVSLVADLVQNGANCKRGNQKGESPLVRAVLVTNSSDNQSFSELLDLLFPCLHLADLTGRTILHHIALTAGIPGRGDASKYYLDTLVEWAVKRRGASGVTWLLTELVNVQDINGDTALNIAARIGARPVAVQLVELGAATSLANRAGLKPTDFGVPQLDAVSGPDSAGFDHVSVPEISTNTADHSSVFRSLPAPVLGRQFAQNRDFSDRRETLHKQAVSALEQFSKDMDQLLSAKHKTLAELHAELKAASDAFTETTKKHEKIAVLLAQKQLRARQIRAIKSAIEAEQTEFEKHDEKPAMKLENTSFDADEPFKVRIGSQTFPTILLSARIKAYSTVNGELTSLRDKLRASSLENEAKFRKVVAQCTSSDESKVDSILDDLLVAVKRDNGVKE